MSINITLSIVLLNTTGFDIKNHCHVQYVDWIQNEVKEIQIKFYVEKIFINLIIIKVFSKKYYIFN